MKTFFSQLFKRADIETEEDKVANSLSEVEFEKKLLESQTKLLSAATGTQNTVEGLVEQLKKKLTTATKSIKFVSEALSDALIVTDKEGNILSLNEAAISMFKIPKNKALKMNVAELMPERYAHRHKMLMLKYHDEQESSLKHLRSINAVRSDGEEFPIEITVNSIMVDSEVHFIALIRDQTERKMFEQRIMNANDRLKYIYNNTPALMFSIDKNLIIVEVSDYFLKHLGYTRSELIGCNIYYLFSVDTREKLKRERISTLINKGSTEPAEYKIYKKNGDLINVIISSVAEYNEDGSFDRSLSVMLDVTHTRKIEKDNTYKQSLINAFISDERIFVIQMDPNYIIKFINVGASNVFEDDPDNLIGRSIYDFIDDIGKPRLTEEFEYIIEHGIGAVIFPLLIGDRVKFIDCYIKAIELPDGKHLELLGIGKDKSEIYRREISINKSREKYRNVVDSLEEGLIIVQDGRVVFTNKAFATRLEFTIKELIGFKVDKLIKEPTILNKECNTGDELILYSDNGREVLTKIEYKMNVNIPEFKQIETYYYKGIEPEHAEYEPAIMCVVKFPKSS